jgi:hypothetical protein
VIRARFVALCAALVALHVGAARAETLIEIPKSKATLTLDDNWQRIAPARNDKGALEVYKHSAGHVLALTRADLPNPDAWVQDKKQAYADQVEKGIKSKVPGYKRLAKKLADANGVPALDIEAKRQDGAIVVVRVLLFRTYALSLAIEVPKAGDVAIARTAVKTFTPPKELTPAASPTNPPKKNG